jgi:Tfp pilus assembly protein PilZ
MARRLRLRFEDAAAFRQEYAENIARGGAFVPTLDRLELRDAVVVEVELAFCGVTTELDAEVVHCLPAEVTGDAATAGVAVQFLIGAPELRDRFERYVPPPARRAEAFDPSALDLEAEGAREEIPFEDEPGAGERRRAARDRAGVAARLDTTQLSLEGRTRDLSEQGVLLSVDGSDLPLGKSVRLTLVHPDTGERLEVTGRVARRVEAPGTVAAVAVDFENGRETRTKLTGFVREVRALEARRRARGISGTIEELGIANLIQMLGKFSRAGTLTLRSGPEEGALSFEGGALRACRIGSLAGVKALARLLSWSEGTFEFHAEIDALDGAGEPVALEGALLAAAAQLDEMGREGSGSIDPGARLRVDARALAASRNELGKTEEAVLDLAAAGLSVRRLLDIIPESDAQVLRAIRALAERGLVEIVS